jgi:hypothetical protein
MRHEQAGLESGFQLSVLQGKHGLDLGLPARLDYWMKRELCQDVTFRPLPEGVVRTAFHAMVVMGGSVARMDAVLEPDESSPAFLHDVVCPPRLLIPAL